MANIIRRAIGFFEHRHMLNFLSDKAYLRLVFWERLGKKLNLENPTTFSEKIQWLKIYDRNPMYTTMVDKFAVKELVAEMIGKDYIIPTLGVWDNFDDIDFSNLPNQFVLKCTHDSGGLVICMDKNTFDKQKAKTKLYKSLKTNYYLHTREWPYKDVKPRIIAEKYMSSKEHPQLVDYKIMCFNGKAKCLFTCTDRYSDNGLKVTFFDTDWNKLPFERHYPSDDKEIPKPESLKQMIVLAEKISHDLTFARIDFYDIDNRPYFGEITFFPGSGMEEFRPEEWDNILGTWLHLPVKS